MSRESIHQLDRFVFNSSGLGKSRMAVFPLIFGLLILSGCASSPFSREIKQRAEHQPDFTELRSRTPIYKGWSVILGGTVIKTMNLKDYTEIEVLQKPLDSEDRPKDTDLSYGRFLVHCKEFLDPAVYEKGRAITVAGKVEGTSTAPLGDVTYTYPVISCDKLKLWYVDYSQPYYYPPPPYWYDPFYWPRYYYPYPYYRSAPLRRM